MMSEMVARAMQVLAESKTNMNSTMPSPCTSRSNSVQCSPTRPHASYVSPVAATYNSIDYMGESPVSDRYSPLDVQVAFICHEGVLYYGELDKGFLFHTMSFDIKTDSLQIIPVTEYWKIYESHTRTMDVHTDDGWEILTLRGICQCVMLGDTYIGPLLEFDNTDFVKCFPRV